jgi:hypothetical protein
MIKARKLRIAAIQLFQKVDFTLKQNLAAKG